MHMLMFCFNPRARVGRDVTNGKMQRCRVVSIHAPAWGATGEIEVKDKAEAVSIHAPAWGATRAV